MAREFESMTVKDLRDELADYPDDMIVAITYPSGDYWGRTLAARLKSHKIYDDSIMWSDYHSSWRTVPSSQEDDEEVESIAVLCIGVD